jgi:transposase
VFQSTAACAASELFNLPGFEVVGVCRDETGGRLVTIRTTATEGGCPSCGVVSGSVHQWTRQRVRDVPFDGPIVVWWLKKRWRCREQLCPRRSFTERTEQVPPRARMTTRLTVLLLDAVTKEVRAVSRVAAEFGVSWPTVVRLLTAAAGVLAARPVRPCRALGIDEHRFRSVRWFRDGDGRWARVEPWSILFTDLDTGAVLGVVDGRDGAAVRAWLRSRPRWWRHRVQVVAIDPSAAFRAALHPLLPHARVSVDHFHLVKLANDALTAVRRRCSWELRDRRGRAVDPAWAHRLLLLRGADTLSPRGWAKLSTVLTIDDPTNQIGAAWGIKEQLRNVLRATTVTDARAARVVLDSYVTAANMPETNKLMRTIDRWWPAVEVFITTRVTNARSEAANLTCKHLKRTGRGYRNQSNYHARIMLHSAARTAA